MENLEAKRALKAFEFANEEETTSLNYSAAVQELPSMLRMNGLRATMAYYYSKIGGHKLVFQQLCRWFVHEEEPTKLMSEKFKAPTKDNPEQQFMAILLGLHDDEYRIVQAETSTLANWMIRFVKTEDAKPKSTTHDTGQPQA
ncbi:MAG: type III-B CRISPR module-associated protein Cmr5 [Saprospiraceae bacterium]|nr:type III-B CRISPR module-associated protein Cmr5 [Saprospiraceae bacterium]MCF8249248.1 type III-B CRISPR module-associated protein Cmr5 [Saprospiraceae bacterium]MCF8281184.1 type III-B CRISPR module-associated protein Cmr5 [Bacteroidales bacterium]MCF8311475.1 type III-B CRISPR module-associated protein Cmr5 [Saprospiraceae bacterium]MCF8439867.1 type III-B CRISPR module-associated protein Cmr5 [Saprospiraceae bacterium]